MADAGGDNFSLISRPSPAGDLDVFDDKRLLVAQRDGCFHLHGMTPE
ncbi:hypothetical protein [Klebsiella pneumoniae ISC21]|nr:hypothetical protein [Klebsiella pneumoniae ISC21]